MRPIGLLLVTIRSACGPKPPSAATYQAPADADTAGRLDISAITLGEEATATFSGAVKRDQTVPKEKVVTVSGTITCTSSQ